IPYDGERSAARNLGAKIAKGNYLYFVDSDFKLEPDVIASCVREIAHADGVVTNDRDLATGSYVSKIIALRKDILSHDSLDLALKFVRKNVFNMLGGYDVELYAGEENDFHRRFLLHSFKMTRSSALVWHLGSITTLREL